MRALWIEGVSDEAIVAMKPAACDDTVTYPRVKRVERDKKSKAKGGTRQRKTELKSNSCSEISIKLPRLERPVRALKPKRGSTKEHGKE